MGRAIMKRFLNMNGRAKVSLILGFTLLLSVFMYHGWYKPKKAQAVDTVVIITAGTSWNVPADWSDVNTIEVIGGGGGGDSAQNTGSGGGGGGAYAKINNLTGLTPGVSVVTIQVGVGGGQDTDGTDTYFDGTGTTCGGQSVCAENGAQGLNLTGGAGGGTGTSIGTTKFAGGNGGIGNTTGDTGGGGGGAGGPNGAGANGGAGESGTASGGGGGNGGGSVGANASAGVGGNGGNGYGGTGGGAGGDGTGGTAGTAGTGGGGGGGDVTPGGAGATGAEWTTAGSGGGGGGAGVVGGDGGLYGSGGGGGEGTGGSGAQGVIVVTYTPAALPTTTVTDGSDPSNYSVCPPANNQQIDTFVLNETTGNGSSSVSAVTVSFGDITDISNVYVKCGATTHGSVAVAGDPQSVSLSPSIFVPAGLTNTCGLWVDFTGGTGTRTASVSGITVTGNEGTITDSGSTVTLECISCDKTIGASPGGCIECHLMPPQDGIRNWITNAVVGDHQKKEHVPSAPDASEAECARCHVLPGADINHRNSLINMGANINGGYYDRNNDQVPDTSWQQTTSPTLGYCSTTYCHGTKSPQWGVGGADCGTCHKAKTGVSGQSLAGEHPVHYNSASNATSREAQNNTTASNYIFNCGVCHDVNPTNQHLDGSNKGTLGTNGYVVDVIFNVSWVSPPTGNFSNGGIGTTLTGDSELKYWTNGTCSNLYCHSDAKATPTYKTVTWTGAAMTCKSCHGGPELNASVLLSQKHAKHMATDSLAYAFRCIECHTGTVGLNNTSITVFSNHVNAIKNVMFYSSMRGSGVNQSGGTYTSGTKTCASLYCHSNANPLGGGNTYQSPVWDTTTTTCSSCHGSPGGAISWSTAHDKHTELYWANYNCNNCHSTTASSNTVIISNAVHVNGTKNVIMSAFSNGTYASSSYTCSNVYCHSAGTTILNAIGIINTVPKWNGGALNCGGCHGNPPAYTNKQPKGNSHSKHTTQCQNCHYTVTTNGTAITNPSLHVNKGNFYNVKNGPGVSNFAYTNNVMPALSTCSNTYCHASSIPQWGGAAMQCFDCHKAHTGGGAVTNLAASHAFHYNTVTNATAITAINNSVNNRYIFNCGICHDVDPTSGHSDANTSSGKVVDVIFNVVFAPAEYRNGIYNVGSTTATGDSGFAYYTNSSCSNVYCHSSVQGTTGGPGPASYGVPSWPLTTLACTQCHANPPATGTHTTHTTAPLSYACTVCHKNFSSQNVAHVNGTINVAIDTTQYGASALYNQVNNPPGNNYSDCSSVYCHGAWGLSGGTDNTPVWGDATTGDCGDCHAATNASPPPGGSHTIHAGASPNLNLLCFDCHGTLGSPHENLSVSWVMNTTNPRFKAYAKYNGTVSGQISGKAPSASYKTCSGVYCHSNVQSASGTAAPSTYATPTWGGTITCSTGGCHSAVATGMPATGSHAVHTNTVAPAYAYQCNDCHNSAGDGTAVHANNSINIAFLVGNVGATANYTQGTASAPGTGGYGTCTTSKCHGTTMDPWGSPSLATYDACTVCHGTRTVGADYSSLSNKIAPPEDTNNAVAATDANVGAHQNHMNSSVYIYNSSGMWCGECHQVPAYSVAGIKGHLNGVAADIVFSNIATEQGLLTPSYTFATGECSGTYCHAGAAGGSNPKPTWANTTYLNVSPLVAQDCGRCHGYPPASPHDPSTDCSSCHNNVDAVGDLSFSTVANRALHIDGVILAAGACLDCHNKRVTSAFGGQRANVGNTTAGDGDDFIRKSKHVSNGTTNPIVTNFDCILCHADGDTTSVTGSIKATGIHKDGSVDLRNVDADLNPGTAGTNYYVWPGWRLKAFNPTMLQRRNMDNFCLACHDANGASGITVNKTNPASGFMNPPGAINALAPFNVLDNFLNNNDTNYGTVANSMGILRAKYNRVLNVKDQFNSTNQVKKNWASHHNLEQFALRYSFRNTTSWPDDTWTTYIPKKNRASDGNGSNIKSLGEIAGLHCSDCHLNEVNAHGSRNAWYMTINNSHALDALGVNDIAPTAVADSLPTDKNLCFRCHLNGYYAVTASNAPTAVLGPRTNSHNGQCTRIDDGTQGTSGEFPFANQCHACHGGFSEVLVNASGAILNGGIGSIHGINSRYYPAWGATASKRYRFMNGAAMRAYTPNDLGPYSAETGWELGATVDGVDCYTLGVANTWSACTGHSGGNDTTDIMRSRSLEY